MTGSFCLICCHCCSCCSCCFCCSWSFDCRLDYRLYHHHHPYHHGRRTRSLKKEGWFLEQDDVMAWKRFTHYWPFVGGRDPWGDSPHTGPVMQSFDDLYIVSLFKLLKKRPNCWCSESTWCSSYSSYFYRRAGLDRNAAQVFISLYLIYMYIYISYVYLIALLMVDYIINGIYQAY